jgi:hypothetical protein
MFSCDDLLMVIQRIRSSIFDLVRNKNSSLWLHSYVLLNICEHEPTYHVLDCFIWIVLSICKLNMDVEKPNADNDLYLSQTDSFWEVCTVHYRQIICHRYFIIHRALDW